MVSFLVKKNDHTFDWFMVDYIFSCFIFVQNLVLFLSYILVGYSSVVTVLRYISLPSKKTLFLFQINVII